MSAQSSGGKFLVIEDWMFELTDKNNKRLTDTSLHLYALLYGFSKHRVGYFHGRRTYFSQRLHTSDSAIRNSLKQLIDAKLIEEIEKPSQGSTIAKRKWAAIMPKDASLPESGDEDFGTHETAGQSSRKLPVSPSLLDSSDESAHCQNLAVSCTDSSDESLLESSSENPIKTLMGAYEKQAVSNSSFKINNNTNPISTIPAAQDEEREGTAVGMDYSQEILKLMDTSLNKSATQHEIKEAYLEALAKGYTPEQIEYAFCEKYQTRYREHNPNYPGYAMRIDNYLRDSRGLRFDAPKPRISRSPKTKSKPALASERKEILTLDEYLCQVLPSYSNLLVEYRTATIDLLRESCGKTKETPRQADLEERVCLLKKQLDHIRQSHGANYTNHVSQQGVKNEAS